MDLIWVFITLSLSICGVLVHLSAAEEEVQCLVDMYLGMSNYRIPDERITASEQWGTIHPPHAARLGLGLGRGKGWCAAYVFCTSEFITMTRYRDRWFQVDLMYPTIVSGITIQCIGYRGEALGHFTVEYGLNATHLTGYLMDEATGEPTEFPGVDMVSTSRIHTVRWQPTLMRVIRLHVTAQNKSSTFNVCMTLDLIGCPVFMKEPVCKQPIAHHTAQLDYVDFEFNLTGLHFFDCAFLCQSASSDPACLGFYEHQGTCLFINTRNISLHDMSPLISSDIHHERAGLYQRCDIPLNALNMSKLLEKLTPDMYL